MNKKLCQNYFHCNSVKWEIVLVLSLQTFNSSMVAHLNVGGEAGAQLLEAVMNSRQQLIEQRQVINTILIQHLIQTYM